MTTKYPELSDDDASLAMFKVAAIMIQSNVRVGVATCILQTRFSEVIQGPGYEGTPEDIKNLYLVLKPETRAKVREVFIAALEFIKEMEGTDPAEQLRRNRLQGERPDVH